MTERFRLHIITDQDVFRHQLHALWSTIGRHLYVSYYIQAQPKHVFGKHGSVGVGPSARVPPSARVTSPRSRRCPAQRLKHCSWISQLLTQHEPSEDFHRSISFCGSLGSPPLQQTESASSCCCFQLWLRLPHHDLTPTLYS